MVEPPTALFAGSFVIDADCGSPHPGPLPWGEGGRVARATNWSDPFEVGGFDGMSVVDLAGVSGGGGFKEENAGFAGGDGLVLDAAGDDAEFSLLKRSDAVAKVNFDLPVEDEKKFVFVGVMMPDVFALKLGEFNVLAVELPHHLWNPVLAKGCELVGEVD